ncbi:MAG: PQQ-dependent sugar dehydrogenase [Leptolyngbya sp. PLA1]|nr:PQQ-dependent sugar dehydrogenase [Leptolyngbya sp. PLA1]
MIGPYATAAVGESDPVGDARMRYSPLALTLLATVALAQPGLPGQPKPTGPWEPKVGEPFPAGGEGPFQRDFEPASVEYTVETVVEGVEVPWAIVWTPDGRMLFTERTGRVREFANGKLTPEPMLTVPVESRAGEIGLMGMCLHPQFAANKFVYVAFGKARDIIHVKRYKEEGGKLVDEKAILQITPAGRNHAGCCLAFGPDGKLYVSTGEAFQGKLAQDLTSLGGKVLRLNDDGTVPADNPFTGTEHKEKGVRPEIWSYGNRNPQGLAWQPGTGALFACEHGPSGENGTGGDELNIIQKGKNYGWPVIHHAMKQDGMETPLVLWDPALAPASASFYDGTVFPELKGNLLVGALGGLGMPQRPGILRIVLEGGNVMKQERLVSNLGRIRCVASGPDGFIYFSTSNRDGRGRPDQTDDRILRLKPKSK